MPELCWLPVDPHWTDSIEKLEHSESVSFDSLVGLANVKLDLLRTNRLDRLFLKHYKTAPPADVASRPVRLAVLGSSTLAHLMPAIRVGALRRGLWVDVYEGAYGQFFQELIDPSSGLHRFNPSIVLFSVDAAQASAQDPDAVLAHLKTCWALARDKFGATVIQQTVLPSAASLMGNNEHRLARSKATRIRVINQKLRDNSVAEAVHLLAIDDQAARDGIDAWHDPVLWHRAKQDVSPAGAVLYGDLVGRIIGAIQGKSAKCAVLDLDNTLWGGVIGDDGLEGIVCGQGSAEGEAFLAVQGYMVQLAERGIILAVCSKNDEANARKPFVSHPEMVLKLDHISCFVANWDDKATNIRRIARELNIGLDSLVFIDDNPFERDIVRRYVPEVRVPEIPDDDPATVPLLLAQAGYFEAVSITAEDEERTKQYRANTQRKALADEAVDVGTYLRGLDMRLIWGRFDDLSLGRVTQLINKTNQFNLRTKRYTLDELKLLTRDERCFGIHFRLLDRFGDNGIIAVVIGMVDENRDCFIDTWLMSCRVLGREVEQASLNVVAAEAKRLGARRLMGEYIPSAKNAMVADLYKTLGFQVLLGDHHRAEMPLANFIPRELHLEVLEG